MKEGSGMKKKILGLILTCVLCLSVCACGTDPELAKFKSDIDNMCNDLVSLNNKMNDIDAASEHAVEELLEYLDELDMKFARFAELDFPEEFDYLEPVSDEASDYMKEAVKYYHEAFKNDSYSEHNASYAQANYECAYKRLQIIMSCLRGEPVNTQTSSDDADK